MGNIDTLHRVIKETKTKQGPDSGPGSLLWYDMLDYFIPSILTVSAWSNEAQIQVV